MAPGEAFRRGMSGLTRFAGRASRSEYWWFLGVVVLVVYGVTFASAFAMPRNWINWVFEIAFWLVSALTLAVFVRRLHDRGLPNWLSFGIALAPLAIYLLDLLVWGLGGFEGRQLIVEDLAEAKDVKEQITTTVFWGAFYGLAALIGLVGLVFSLLPSQPGHNRYGPSPHEAPA